MADHSGHQANAKTVRPRQAAIMPHNVAVRGSKSGHSRPSSGCSSGVICRCRTASWRASKPRSAGPIIGVGLYALVSEESTPLASEPMLLPIAA